MNKSILSIGIDIGWSEQKRSCAFAALDPLHVLPWPDRTKSYGSESLRCCRFRLSELIAFLAGVRPAISNYDQTLVVLDGPLGPGSKPVQNRPVDSSFRRGQFRNRMQPADIDNESGRIYVDATYQVVDGLDAACSPWVGGPTDSSIVITETNPTVGLALMNRKYEWEELPSRKRPLVPPKNERSEGAMRAKSDFYWRVGGNVHCASILQDALVAEERNHENVAGLYCLAVASTLSVGEAISCGDKQSGVYVFPNCIDGDWHSDLESIGIEFGTPEKTKRASSTNDFSNWSRANSGSKNAENNSNEELSEIENTDDELAGSGDLEILLLNDNGGIWERHNDWLEGLGGPVVIRCTKTDTQATLNRAESERQWTSQPTALTLARLHGFDRDHLSCEHSIAIEIEIMEVEI